MKKLFSLLYLLLIPTIAFADPDAGPDSNKQVWINGQLNNFVIGKSTTSGNLFQRLYGANDIFIGTTKTSGSPTLFPYNTHDTTCIGVNTNCGGAGNENTVMGSGAGAQNNSSSVNANFFTAYGYNAVSDEAGVVIGALSIANQDSVVIGYEASDDVGGTHQTNAGNVVIGEFAQLYGGKNNVCIGLNGCTYITGNNNIMLGNGVGAGDNAVTNNIFLGNGVRGTTTAESNQLDIGYLLHGDLTNAGAGKWALWLASTASAVDYAIITPSATGSPGIVQVGATGTDTNVNLSLTTKGSGVIALAGGITSTGTKFTISGCSAGTTVGGATAGSFVSGTTGTCTVTITLNGATGAAAANGWSCWSNDETTNTDKMVETGSTTTTVTLSGTTFTSDVIDFGCVGY